MKCSGHAVIFPLSVLYLHACFLLVSIPSFFSFFPPFLSVFPPPPLSSFLLCRFLCLCLSIFHSFLLPCSQYCYEESMGTASSSSTSGLSYCDLLLETFVCFFVSTCGHYLEHVNEGSSKKTFNKAEFCKATFSESLKMFLTW